MKKVFILLSSVFMAGCFVCNKGADKVKIEEPVEEVVVAEEAPVAPAPAPKKQEPSSYSVPEAANFAFDSKTPVMNEGKIDEIIADWKKSPDQIIYVEGHTDNIGPEWYNNKLSLERARAIANALKEKGVPEEKIRVSGAGFSKPIASNETREGRAKNRRVDVVLKQETAE